MSNDKWIKMVSSKLQVQDKKKNWVPNSNQTHDLTCNNYSELETKVTVHKMATMCSGFNQTNMYGPTKRGPEPEYITSPFTYIHVVIHNNLNCV